MILQYACRIHDNLNMATLTRTLKLPFLRLNKAKAKEFARLECLNTEVANQILAMPKAERRELTTKSFTHLEIASGWINQTIRNANARTKVKHFRRLPLETNNQNWALHRVGDTFSVSFGLLRGTRKRIPIKVHLASHRELLEAILNGSAKPGNIKLFCSRRGIWYVLISVSMEVPDAEPRDRWIGVDRGQNVPVVAATPDGPVVFWKARHIRHVRRVFARRRQMLQAKGKHRAVRKLENKERRIVTHINHVMSKQLVALAKRCQAGIRFEDLPGIRASARQRRDTRSDAGRNRDDWPFHQLETFVRYKSLAAGVAVDAVPLGDQPTSKACLRRQAVRIQGARRCQCCDECPGWVWAVLPAGSSCSSGRAA